MSRKPGRTEAQDPEVRLFDRVPASTPPLRPKRNPHRLSPPHSFAVGGGLWELRRVDAVGFHPLRHREQVGIGDRIGFAHQMGLYQRALVLRRIIPMARAI
jgi:hypothetical protein